MRKLVWIVAMSALGAGAPRADQLARRLEDEMRTAQIPAVSIAVERQGHVVRQEAFGYADLEWLARATPNTRFEIASVSKMFTGAAARILIERGKLDREDPVSRYLPGLPDSWAGMKVRHLLTMSTGLPEDWGSEVIPYGADVIAPGDDASTLRSFASLSPVAPLGQEFHYSSPGYAMLGMIVAKLAGMPLPEFVRQTVFEPAGMKQTSFIDNRAIVPERASGYRVVDGKLEKGWYLGQYLHARPDVGMLSTAGDLVAWLVALRSGKVLPDPDALWRESTSDAGRALDYDYGWSIGAVGRHRRASHDGRYRTGFRSVLDFYRDDDLGIAVLANSDSAEVEKLALMVARAYLPDLPDPAAGAAPRDTDPERTARAIAALRGVAEGRIDAKLMTPDALEPLSLAEASGILHGVASYGYAGAEKLPAGGLHLHGHELKDYLVLRVGEGAGRFFLSLYRDEHGLIAYIQPVG